MDKHSNTAATAQAAASAYTDPQTGRFAPGNPGRPAGSRNHDPSLYELVARHRQEVVTALIKRVRNGDAQAIETAVRILNEH